MGILEPEFSRLHWPPLVREIVQTVEYPGYRYEFFRSFTELDAYFTAEIGSHWRTELWARYWINQHKESQREDRKDADPRLRKPTGPRRDMAIVRAESHIQLELTPTLSSYKLVTVLKTKDITITQKTAWDIIRKWKNARG